MQQQFFIYQTSFLHPMFCVLKTQNVNINALIRNTQLRHFDVKADDKYIPSCVVYEFLKEVKRLYKVDMLFHTNCYNYGLLYQGEFGCYLRSRQTLKIALLEFISLSKTIQTNLKSFLNSDKGLTTFSFELLDDFCTGRHMAELSTLMKLLNLFRNFIKLESQGIQLIVPHRSLNCAAKLISGGIEIMSHHDSMYQFNFPTTLLHENNKTKLSSNNNIRPEYESMDLVDLVSKVIESYKPGYLPSLQSLSNHFNISRSTMRRVLLKQQTCFSELLENILFTKASRLLSVPNMNIMMVSEYLGYTESANFIRSFKKWTGITPGEYRESYYF